MYYEHYNDALPVGFSMALAANSVALGRFSALSERERAELTARAHGITSPEEMREFVDRFAIQGGPEGLI